MRIKKLLPDPFVLNDGTRITSLEQWPQWRAETKELVLELEYGTMPGAPEDTRIEVLKTKEEDGHVSWKSMRFTFVPSKKRPDISFKLDVNIWFPSPAQVNRARQRVPALGKGGLPCVIYVGSNPCVELLENGYVIINYQNDQLDPMEMGKPIIGPARSAYQKLEAGKYTWGSIAAWAWGAIRMVDHAISLPEVNKQQIAITGHSRNGKTALLAGAIDDRIAVVNPAGSGCAGAGSYLALDEGCEDIASLTDTRRWWAWMHPDFATLGYFEDKMLFDQHFLMGLVAPRPLLRTEGILDEWANPKGTIVAFLATDEIYKFHGVPDRNQLALRAGGHAQTHEDLLALLSLANWHFFGVSQERVFKDLACEPATIPPFMNWKCPEK
ncbi:MAG: hypothetical protein GYA24_23875 [Candidatus Lokiarchaeota archaeon]|nr:hypothetical protein [Candidatus Lokiarchaeota archaeon]